MKIKEIYENIIAFLIENFTTICEKFEKASKMTEEVKRISENIKKDIDTLWKSMQQHRQHEGTRYVLVNPDGELDGYFFNDQDYVRYVIDPGELGERLCSLACYIQSTELRKQFSMYDIFTFDELYNYWQINNAYWYSFYGPNKLNEGKGMYVQSNLLRNIIQAADSCIQLGHPGATMRFAHESDVMPLTCLLNVNGYGTPRSSLEQLDDEDWINYKIYPMGCNLQFIFYRGKAGSPILFKLLLNEDEAVLPDLKPVTGPYYKWSDFRDFFLKKLQDAPRP